MGAYGTKTRTFLEISLKARQSSEGGRPPGPATYELRINGLELDVLFRRARRNYWSWSFQPGWGQGQFSTPWFFAEISVSEAFLSEVTTSGDYPDDERVGA